MYKIFADSTLIYDSTIEDYKIGKGSITLETNKSGSFVFSVYPDHFFYDSFVKLRTVITVYKSNKIIFRGRILSEVSDYWNNKVITCEGELGFLQDSIIRPFDIDNTPEALFVSCIEAHNSQVEPFQRFKIGTVTVTDPDYYITRSNKEYESSMTNLNKQLVDTLGGYLYITHGEDGTEEIPTINYLADFTNVSTQTIEFGTNLKNYTKTAKATDIATVLIPVGAEVDDGLDSTENKRLTIALVNGGKDYIYDAEAVAKYGWITAVETWDDVSDPLVLKSKAEKHLKKLISHNITVELTAIDLHLLDKSIESFKVGDYINVSSEPHNFNEVMLCNKQTIDLLKPDNDTVTLGYTFSTFTETSGKMSAYAPMLAVIRSTVKRVTNNITILNEIIEKTNGTAEDAVNDIKGLISDLESISNTVDDHVEKIKRLGVVDALLATSVTRIDNHDLSIAGILARLLVLESKS